MARTLTFSDAPVQGKIYYTQCLREGGSGLANVMMADPGSENAALPAFGTSDGCPVWHTMSANGNVFATADRQYSATLGGISAVNANGSLSPIADGPTRVIAALAGDYQTRRLPTGVSADERTLFNFNEQSMKQEARWRDEPKLSSPLYDLVDLGARRGAQPNAACDLLYSQAAGDVVVERD